MHCPFITKELILILEYKTFQQNRDFSKPIVLVNLLSHQTKTASEFCHPQCAEMQFNSISKGPRIPFMVRFVNLCVVARY